MAKAKPVPDGYHTLTPQLMLDNAGQTIDWYKRAFGVEEVSRFVGPDGKIMHAELKIGDSRFTVGEVMKDQKGPTGLWRIARITVAIRGEQRRALQQGGQRRREGTHADGESVLGRSGWRVD